MEIIGLSTSLTSLLLLDLDSTFVPMGFAQKDGSYAGFDIDLATAVFEKYGITVNWQTD